MQSKSKTRQASPLLLLLITVSFAAILFYVFAVALRAETNSILLIILFVPLGLYSACSVILFSVLYPLGKFNKYIYEQVSGPASPFANERLPTQIIAPTDSQDAK